ncbi:MAG: hypothetical protein C6P37_07905 [Caldibacillus debilis]|uniref:Uncharacterized protein n=1 Tax=Caldibacillus debilis TaxID=301148 RepID=A0A3E0K4C9_9BACI|nr:hypothetical protein [Bacillaceae bacterium]MBY6273371.1 hypothetical protein [Bacillaceae bacterium]REJ28560.1 MAG: hypothetical protein C6P37_07905 [Caldibacillus debilis]
MRLIFFWKPANSAWEPLARPRWDGRFFGTGIFLIRRDRTAAEEWKGLWQVLSPGMGAFPFSFKEYGTVSRFL